MEDGLSNLKVEGVNWTGEGFGNVRFQQGNRVVQFYDKETINATRSAEKGRPQWDLKTHIRSFVPGEQRYEIVDRPATTRDRQMYPMQWNAYVEGREAIPDGTLLNAVFPYKPDIVRNLQSYHIYTAEQLAELSATSIDSIGMGCQGWVNEAKRYLEVTSKGASLSQVRRELEERDTEIRVLKNQVEQLKKQLDQMLAAQGSAPAVDPGMLAQITAQVMAGMQGMQGVRPTTQVQTFDAQTAQINAVHPTADIVKQKKQPRRAKAGA